MYDNLGSELPAYTQLFVNLSVWFKANMFSLMFFMFLSFFFVWVFTLTDTGRLGRDRLMLKIPLFGNLIQQNILSKYFRCQFN